MESGIRLRFKHHLLLLLSKLSKTRMVTRTRSCDNALALSLLAAVTSSSLSMSMNGFRFWAPISQGRKGLPGWPTNGFVVFKSCRNK